MRSTFLALLITSVLAPVLPGAEPPSNVPLGHGDFNPTPERPVGFLGDFGARYPGAHDQVLEWDPTTGKNILWKALLPGWGHSCPILVGTKIFLTCESDLTVCLDAGTGAILWQQAGGTKLTRSSGIYHNATGYGMGTPCSDGKNLFVTFYNGLVLSYDFAGKVRWRKDVTPVGWNGSSPVLVDGKFVVTQGVPRPGDDGTGKIGLWGPYDVVAYACEDGAVAWRSTGVLRMNGWHYNGLVPLWIAGAPYLVNWCGQFFDARSGRLLAQLVKAEGWGSIWVPAVEGDTVVFAHQLKDLSDWRSGMQDLAKPDVPVPAGMQTALQRNPPKDSQLILPVRVLPDGKGGLRFEPRRPVLILHKGSYNNIMLAHDILYFIFDGRTITAIDLATGAAVNPGGYDGWSFPEGADSKGYFFTHPVMAGDYLTVGDWFGCTRVFSRGPEFRLIATNKTAASGTRPSGGVIGGPMASQQTSPFFQGDRMFYRHWDVLYCIGDTAAAEHAAAFAAAKEHATGGRIPQAQQAYHQLWNAEPLHIRYRAVKEMGAVLGAQALDELCLAFRAKDPNLRALAVSAAARIPGEAVARRLAEGLSDPDQAYRCQVLDALGPRGGRSASSQLATALDDKVAEVRLAAIAAASRIGGAVLVQEMVARLERFAEAERQAASAALIAMPEPETEERLAGLVPQAAPLPRSVILRALGSRGAVARTALVLGEAGHANRSVRVAALGALAMIASTKELDPVIARLRPAVDDGERKAVEGALLGIFSRTRAVDAFVSAVQRGLGTVEGPGFASLIRVLGPAGGAAALAEVRKALPHKDAAIHAAAIDALAVWPDLTSEPDLVRLAKNERSPSNLSVVVRGLLHLVDLSPAQRPVPQVYALYARAFESDRDLESIVNHLTNRKEVEALEILLDYLDRPELEAAITNTLTMVAVPAADRDAARTVKALAKAMEGIKSPKRRGEVDAVVKTLIGKHGEKALVSPTIEDEDL